MAKILLNIFRDLLVVGPWTPKPSDGLESLDKGCFVGVQDDPLSIGEVVAEQGRVPSRSRLEAVSYPIRRRLLVCVSCACSQHVLQRRSGSAQFARVKWINVWVAEAKDHRVWIRVCAVVFKKPSVCCLVWHAVAGSCICSSFSVVWSVWKAMKVIEFCAVEMYFCLGGVLTIWSLNTWHRGDEKVVPHVHISP